MFVRFRKAEWRLKVAVVQSARRGSKVVQETVAYLGSIDSRALMVPDDERERASIAARVAFWEWVNPRLKSLVNRLGGEAEVKRLRMAIHARIPWPMQPERARLEVLEAEAEAKGWRRLYETTQKQIESHDELIASTTESNEKLRREALRQIEQANKWAAEAENLRKRA